MEERIEKLEKENVELKKIIATAINCMVTIAESTCYPAMIEVESLINYCNNSGIFTE